VKGETITRPADAKGGETVKPTNREQSKRHPFDSFCKKVLKNEVWSCYAEIKRQRDKEVSLQEL